MGQLQKLERCTYYDLPIYCSFCGKKVINLNDEEDNISPCEHTLFVAHDEGFMFLSDRVKKQLSDHNYKISQDEEGFIDIDLEDSQEDMPSTEEITDSLDFTDGYKIAAYVGPPSGFGTYVGFAPFEEE